MQITVWGTSYYRLGVLGSATRIVRGASSPIGPGPMTDLATQIEGAFGSEPLPSKEELVRFDGFDDLGKEYLVEHLGGKTQREVLRLLRDGALGTGSMCTEELELAEPAGIRYYLKPFLVHLAESIKADARALDDEMPFFFFAHVGNILEHRGKHIFTGAQLAALSSLVKESQRLLSSLSEGIWIEDVSREIDRVDEALQRAWTSGPT